MDHSLGNELTLRGLDSVAMQAVQSAKDAAWCRGANDEMLTSRGTILLVEDEPFVREVTREVLQSAGYEVFVAKNAAEAVGIYDGRRAEVDLLLTDVILPGETGRVLAARLQQANPMLRVLYVTGYAEQMGMRVADQGDCLPKPFSTEALLRRVRQRLDQPRFVTGSESGAMLACDSV